MSTETSVLETPGAAPARASRERVDVWQAALAPTPHAIEAALRTLSAAERAHAARLRVGADRWVAARAALRGVLGRYLDLAPERVALAIHANGKPRLEPSAGVGLRLRFNLSHSGEVLLIAVRLDHEVGVDVEKIRDGVDGAVIARDVFDAHERATMATLAAANPRERFFHAWVRREALAKATGRGLLSPARERESARFTVRALDGIPGFAAAVASEGAAWSLAPVRAGMADPA